MPANPPRSDQDWFDLGVQQYSKKEFQLALSAFERVSDPDLEIMKHYHIGMCLVNLGRLDEALTHYRLIHTLPQVKLLEKDDVMYGLYINMGSVLQVLSKKLGQKLLDESIECYMLAQKSNDTDPRVWNNLGNCYLDQHKYEEAEAAFHKAIELDDEFAGPHYSLSLVYEFTERYAQAVEELEKVLEFKPQDKFVLNRLAGLTLGIGDFTKAKSFTEKLVKLYPTDATSLQNHALVLYDIGDFDGSYEFYQKFKQYSPPNAAIDPEILVIFKDLESRILQKAKK